ncbi:hypothetical protein ASF02_21280 [Pseudomonas sp. Leaf58]|nr:hypothetical protein ASF02_21280 [Pseudomonas sp. Leaf58]
MSPLAGHPLPIIWVARVVTAPLCWGIPERHQGEPGIGLRNRFMLQRGDPSNLIRIMPAKGWGL